MEIEEAIILWNSSCHLNKEVLSAFGAAALLNGVPTTLSANPRILKGQKANRILVAEFLHYFGNSLIGEDQEK